MAAMNGHDDPIDALLTRAGQALRERSAPGWDSIADTVIAAVRTTPRSGCPVTAEDPNPHQPPLPGYIAVSDLVIRAALADALRLDQLCAPTAVDVHLNGTHLHHISIDITGRYNTALTDVADHARNIAATTLHSLLGAAARGRDIDITVTDIVSGNPLTE